MLHVLMCVLPKLCSLIFVAIRLSDGAAWQFCWHIELMAGSKSSDGQRHLVAQAEVLFFGNSLSRIHNECSLAADSQR